MIKSRYQFFYYYYFFFILPFSTGGRTFSESRAKMTCEAVTSDRQFRCGHDQNGKQFLIDEEYIYIGYEKIIHTQRSFDFETGKFVNEKSYLQDLTNPYAKPRYYK